MIASVDSREFSRIVASAILPLRRVSSICHVDVDSAVRIWDYAFGSFPAAFSARVNQAVAAIAIGVGDIDGEWWHLVMLNPSGDVIQRARQAAGELHFGFHVVETVTAVHCFHLMGEEHPIQRRRILTFAGLRLLQRWHVR